MADESLPFEQNEIILKFCRKLENDCEYQRKVVMLLCDRNSNTGMSGRIRRKFEAERVV